MPWEESILSLPRKSSPETSSSQVRTSAAGRAPAVLKKVGVKAIVAASFGRIFYRNAVNLGIPMIECRETSLVKDGEVIEIDSEKGEIEIMDSGRKLKGSTLPDFMIKIVEAGGLVQFKRNQITKE
jgi:3-isopropylmalate/(R)-2-methylmalate dehydratase small subunit